MRTKRKIMLLLALTIFILAVSAALSEADDTFNFYFQKAPGPQIVNQGSAGQTSLPQAGQANTLPAIGGESATVVPQPGAVAAPAPTSVAANYSAPGSVYRKWQFSLGYAMPFRDGKREKADPYSRYDTQANRYSPGGQYVAGLQLNVTEVFGILGELYYLPKRTGVKSGGRRTDWSLGAVVTPVTWRLDSVVSVALSGVGGVITVPSEGLLGGKEVILHSNVPYYGARLAIGFNDKIALNASARRITKFSTTQGNVSLAYLF